MRSLRVLLATVLAVSLLAPVGAQQFRQVPSYRILIANDDGIRAEGLRHLASIMQQLGTVLIVGPSANQSGKGHSIVTSEPVFREDITLPNGMAAIGLSATPASAVNIAIRNIVQPRPDLVVSGINHGYNLAYSAYLSGTVGAARQGAMHGIPAIAVSMAEAGVPRDFVAAAEETLWIAARVKQWGLPPNTFLNVNIPARPADGYKGVQVTRQALQEGGQESFAEAKHPRSGQPIYFNVYKEGAKAPEGTDIWAVESGFISVTPMKLGETDPSQVDAIKAWFK
jgi:5'-nucleotidase